MGSCYLDFDGHGVSNPEWTRVVGSGGILLGFEGAQKVQRIADMPYGVRHTVQDPVQQLKVALLCCCKLCIILRNIN